VYVWMWICFPALSPSFCVRKTSKSPRSTT
jgi:hypothetical protein